MTEEKPFELQQNEAIKLSIFKLLEVLEAFSPCALARPE